MRKIILSLFLFIFWHDGNALGLPVDGQSSVSSFSGKGIVEANGPVRDALVTIRAPSGEIITTAQTKDGGVFSYAIPENMRYLLEKYPFLLVESRGGKDSGADIDVSHLVAQEIKWTVRGLIPSSMFRKGDFFSINSISSYIVESMVWEWGPFSMDRIDRYSKQLWIVDYNSDGIVNYEDVITYDFAKKYENMAKNLVYEYMQALYSGNRNERRSAIERIHLRQNHAIISLVPGDSGRPSVRLKKSPSALKILYTVDGSYPEIDGKTTKEYASGTLIENQDIELMYAEVFLREGAYVMGEVDSFLVQHDPIAWSLEHYAIDSDIPTEPVSSPYSYEDVDYVIFTQYDLLREMRKYPAQIWLEVDPGLVYPIQYRYTDRVIVYDETYEQELRKVFTGMAEEAIHTMKQQKN